MPVFRPVGTLSTLRPGLGAAQLTAAASLVGPAAPSGVLPLVSPWGGSDGKLASVVWQDLFGSIALRPVTRAEAMAVPAMSRARHIICGTICRVDLRGYRGDAVLDGPAAPPWINATDGPLSPLHRMLWTVDDLVFYGWSCWRRTNGVDGYPLRMNRVPIGQWSVDSVGRVSLDRLDGEGMQLARADEVVMIPGPHEGLLSFAAESIRHAADLQRSAGTAASTPAAHLVLQQTEGLPLTDEEIDGLIVRWAQARRGENGGVAYASRGITVSELGSFDAHLLIDGRNAAAVDIARHASIPADLIDASTEASMTYSNSRDNDRRGVDYGTGFYMGAVSAALSQDNVSPRGQRVAFDLERWLQGTVPGQPAGTPGGPAATTTPPTAQQQETPA